MSYRYPASYIKPGLNTLVNGTPSYTYYLNTWGLNNQGQLGLGNTTYKSSPNQVGSLTNWLQVGSGGYYHTIAVKTDGTLWAWGGNGVGQLGTGNTTAYSSPKQVGALTNWASVNCGRTYTMAVKTDGTLWGWGRGTTGQLGNNNLYSYSSPKQVGALTNWLSVACGAYSTIAVKTNGTLWSWGRNTRGQLALGNTTYYSSPKQVGALTDWLKVFCGYSFTMAIKTNGTLWGWGINNDGNLGIGSSGADIKSPVQVGSLTTWKNVSAGQQDDGAFCVATRTDGTAWSWGYNRQGQLGLNTTNYYATISSPTQIGALTNWSVTASTQGATLAVKTDGTLWSWGLNNYGNLGLGNTTNYSSPKQVGALTNWANPAAGFRASIVFTY
jgi:alpha-tubulin suppressor-like RCC1 family protein